MLKFLLSEKKIVKEHFSRVLCYAAIVLIVIVCYRGLTDTEFIGDDHPRISFEAERLDKGFASAITAILPDRPVLMMVIYADYLLGGSDPFYYKLTSLMLHLGLGILIFTFFRYFQKTHLKNDGMALPLIFTLLFLAHPANTQTLTSSIQMGVILAAIGMVGAVMYYTKYLYQAGRSNYLLSILYFTIGILAKPIIITVPIMLFIFLLNARQVSRYKLLQLAPFLLLCLYPILFYVIFRVNEQSIYAPLDWLHYFLAQTRIVFLYFKLFLLPTNLHFHYDLDPYYDFYSWKTWLAVSGHLSIGLLTYWGSKTIRYLWVGVLCTYIALLPESSFFSIKHIAFEHRMYIPYIFMCMTLLIVSNHLQAKKRKGIFGLSLLGIFIFSFWTPMRVSEVSTSEKWALNDYQSRIPSRAVNLEFINYCWASNSRSSSIIKMVLQMHAQDPEYIPYKIFSKMFSYQDYSQEQKRKVIEEIGNFLITGRDAIEMSIRYNFIQFLIEKLQIFFADQVEFAKHLEPVLRDNIFYFKNYPDTFKFALQTHLQVLAILKNHLENKSIKLKLSKAELVRYFLVLEQLSYLFPQKAKAFFGKLEKFEREYPEEKLLVNDLRKKYLKIDQ